MQCFVFAFLCSASQSWVSSILLYLCILIFYWRTVRQFVYASSVGGYFSISLLQKAVKVGASKQLFHYVSHSAWTQLSWISCPSEWWLGYSRGQTWMGWYVQGSWFLRWEANSRVPLGALLTWSTRLLVSPLYSVFAWCGSKGSIPRSSFPEDNKPICAITLRPGIRNLGISFLSQSSHQIIMGQS